MMVSTSPSKGNVRVALPLPSIIPAIASGNIESSSDEDEDVKSTTSSSKNNSLLSSPNAKSAGAGAGMNPLATLFFSPPEGQPLAPFMHSLRTNVQNVTKICLAGPPTSVHLFMELTDVSFVSPTLALLESQFGVKANQARTKMIESVTSFAGKAQKGMIEPSTTLVIAPPRSFPKSQLTELMSHYRGFKKMESSNLHAVFEDSYLASLALTDLQSFSNFGVQFTRVPMEEDALDDEYGTQPTTTLEIHVIPASVTEPVINNDTMAWGNIGNFAGLLNFFSHFNGFKRIAFIDDTVTAVEFETAHLAQLAMIRVRTSTNLSALYVSHHKTEPHFPPQAASTRELLLRLSPPGLSLETAQGLFGHKGSLLSLTMEPGHGNRFARATFLSVTRAEEMLNLLREHTNVVANFYNSKANKFEEFEERHVHGRERSKRKSSNPAEPTIPAEGVSVPVEEVAVEKSTKLETEPVSYESIEPIPEEKAQLESEIIAEAAEEFEEQHGRDSTEEVEEKPGDEVAVEDSTAEDAAVPEVGTGGEETTEVDASAEVTATEGAKDEGGIAAQAEVEELQYEELVKTEEETEAPKEVGAEEAADAIEGGDESGKVNEDEERGGEDEQGLDEIAEQVAAEDENAAVAPANEGEDEWGGEEGECGDWNDGADDWNEGEEAPAEAIADEWGSSAAQPTNGEWDASAEAHSNSQAVEGGDWSNSAAPATETPAVDQWGFPIGGPVVDEWGESAAPPPVEDVWSGPARPIPAAPSDAWSNARPMQVPMTNNFENPKRKGPRDRDQFADSWDTPAGGEFDSQGNNWDQPSKRGYSGRDAFDHGRHNDFEPRRDDWDGARRSAPTTNQEWSNSRRDGGRNDFGHHPRHEPAPMNHDWEQLQQQQMGWPDVRGPMMRNEPKPVYAEPMISAEALLQPRRVYKEWPAIRVTPIPGANIAFNVLLSMSGQPGFLRLIFEQDGTTVSVFETPAQADAAGATLNKLIATRPPFASLTTRQMPRHSNRPEDEEMCKFIIVECTAGVDINLVQLILSAKEGHIGLRILKEGVIRSEFDSIVRAKQTVDDLTVNTNLMVYFGEKSSVRSSSGAGLESVSSKRKAQDSYNVSEHGGSNPMYENSFSGSGKHAGPQSDHGVSNHIYENSFSGSRKHAEPHSDLPDLPPNPIGWGVPRNPDAVPAPPAKPIATARRPHVPIEPLPTQDARNFTPEQDRRGSSQRAESFNDSHSQHREDWDAPNQGGGSWDNHQGNAYSWDSAPAAQNNGGSWDENGANGIGPHPDANLRQADQETFDTNVNGDAPSDGLNGDVPEQDINPDKSAHTTAGPNSAPNGVKKAAEPPRKPEPPIGRRQFMKGLTTYRHSKRIDDELEYPSEDAVVPPQAPAANATEVERTWDTDYESTQASKVNVWAGAGSFSSSRTTKKISRGEPTSVVPNYGGWDYDGVNPEDLYKEHSVTRVGGGGSGGGARDNEGLGARGSRGGRGGFDSYEGDMYGGSRSGGRRNLGGRSGGGGGGRRRMRGGDDWD